MPEVKALVCGYPDCGKWGPDAEVFRYRVQVDGDRWDMDLCREHAEPLYQLREATGASRPRGRTKLTDLIDRGDTPPEGVERPKK